jgi:urease accessory protein UreH
VNSALLGRGTAERQVLEAIEGSRLAWHGEPRILHSGADHLSTIDIDVDESSSVLVVDSFIIHPDAAEGRYRGVFSVRRAGVLVALDRVDLDIGDRAFQEYTCFGAIWLIGGFDSSGCDERWQRVQEGAYAVASRLPRDAGFGIRIAAHSAFALRRMVDAYLTDIELLGWSRETPGPGPSWAGL